MHSPWGDISVPSGGTSRITAFVKSLKKNGFDVHLVVPSPEKEFSKDLKDIELHTVPIKESGVKSQPVRALLVSRKAKRIAKKNDAILQIEHSTLAGFATLTVCSDFIIDMHDLAFDSPLYTNLLLPKLVQKFIYKMERRAVNHASKIIVVSNPMKEFIIKAWNAPEEKIEVISNGYFESKSDDFKNIREVDGMISFIGTLHPKLDMYKIIKNHSKHEMMIRMIREGFSTPIWAVPRLFLTPKISLLLGFGVLSTFPFCLILNCWAASIWNKNKQVMSD